MKLKDFSYTVLLTGNGVNINDVRSFQVRRHQRRIIHESHLEQYSVFTGKQLNKLDLRPIGACELRVVLQRMNANCGCERQRFHHIMQAETRGGTLALPPFSSCIPTPVPRHASLPSDVMHCNAFSRSRCERFRWLRAHITQRKYRRLLFRMCLYSLILFVLQPKSWVKYEYVGLQNFTNTKMQMNTGLIHCTSVSARWLNRRSFTD